MYLFFARDLVRAKQISYQNADQLEGPYREALDLLWAMAETDPGPDIDDLQTLLRATRDPLTAHTLAAAAYVYGYNCKFG